MAHANNGGQDQSKADSKPLLVYHLRRIYRKSNPYACCLECSIETKVPCQYLLVIRQCPSKPESKVEEEICRAQPRLCLHVSQQSIVTHTKSFGQAFVFVASINIVQIISAPCSFTIDFFRDK